MIMDYILGPLRQAISSLSPAAPVPPAQTSAGPPAEIMPPPSLSAMQAPSFDTSAPASNPFVVTDGIEPTDEAMVTATMMLIQRQPPLASESTLQHLVPPHFNISQSALKPHIGCSHLLALIQVMLFQDPLFNQFPSQRTCLACRPLAYHLATSSLRLYCQEGSHQ